MRRPLVPQDNGIRQLTFRGINFPSYFPGTFADAQADAAMDALPGLGFNWVAIVATWYSANQTDTAIAPGANTETDANIVHQIARAHAAGLKVCLKPHNDLADFSFKGTISPSNRATWYANFKAFLLHFAQMATDNGCEMFCLGGEQQSMTCNAQAGDSAAWSDIVSSVRAVYSGPLVFAALSTEAPFTYIWPLFDYVGVDIYPQLALSDAHTIDEFVTAWLSPPPDTARWGSLYQTHLGANTSFYNYLVDLAATSGKPIIIMEIGWLSAAGAANNLPTSTVDYLIQQKLFESFFRFWNTHWQSWLKGAFFWRQVPTPQSGDPLDYTIIGKPVADNVALWYKGTQIPLPPPPAPPPGPSTWNAADKFTGIVLSNGNLTATHDGTNFQWEMVRATNGKSSGKWYWEYTIDATDAGGTGVGVNGPISVIAAQKRMGETDNWGVGYYNTTPGVVFGLQSTLSSSLETYVTGDVIGVAMDCDNKKLWFRRNAGNWNNDVIGNQNPASNVGGFDITTEMGGGALKPAIAHSSSGNAVTLNAGATAFAHTAPTGFSAIL